MATVSITSEQARDTGTAVGIDWETSPFDVEQFRAGMESSWNTDRTIRKRTSPTTT